MKMNTKKTTGIQIKTNVRAGATCQELSEQYMEAHRMMMSATTPEQRAAALAQLRSTAVQIMNQC